MDLRQLRYFTAVAEELHFGRAAARLHISQAPLSTQIQNLEREIGHRLLHRTTRSVELTAAGAEFYRRAAAVLGQAGELTTDLDLVEQGKAGQLRVGFVSSASYELLPRAIRLFRETAPGVRLEALPMTSGEQADHLRRGELDLGIIRGENGAPGLAGEEVFREEIVACLPSDHALAAAEELRAEELSSEPLIFFPEREMPGYAAEIRPLFQGLRFPQVYTRIVQQETALGFVAAGLGYTLLPASVTAFAPRQVALRPIAGRPQTGVYAALPGQRLSPAAERFLGTLHQVGRERRGRGSW